MEGAVERDDVPTARRMFGELDGRLEDVVAGVGVEERVDRLGGQLGEPSGHRFEQVVRVDVDLGVDETLRLVGDGLHHFGMAVPRRRRSDTGSEVEVGVIVHVVDAAALTSDDLQVGHLGPDVRQVRAGRRCGGHDGSLRVEDVNYGDGHE